MADGSELSNLRAYDIVAVARIVFWPYRNTFTSQIVNSIRTGSRPSHCDDFASCLRSVAVF